MRSDDHAGQKIENRRLTQDDDGNGLHESANLDAGRLLKTTMKTGAMVERRFQSDTTWHMPDCRCSRCSEDDRLRETRITHDAPTNNLPSQSVSLRELVDNATLTLPPRYEIGEDWNDD